jgi:hypothetical protein
MPATGEIPEPPRHKLVITGKDGNTVNWVNSDPLRTESLAHKQHLIVRCGVCGHDATDWGTMRGHAYMDHDMHFSKAHVGTKIVWRRADLPDARAAVHSSPVIRESRYNEEDNEWDEYLYKARGDCSDEKAVEIARGKLDNGERAHIVIEHRPPRKAYPGSVEEGSKKEVRPAPDNPPEAIA